MPLRRPDRLSQTRLSAVPSPQPFLPASGSAPASRRSIFPPRPGQPTASGLDPASDAEARNQLRRADAHARDQQHFGGPHPAAGTLLPSLFEVPNDRLDLLNLLLDSGAKPPGLAREAILLSRWAPELRPLARALFDEAWKPSP